MQVNQVVRPDLVWYAAYDHDMKLSKFQEDMKQINPSYVVEKMTSA